MNLTIIITASFSPSHPNITYIQTVIESLNYLIIDSSNKITVLLCHDSLNPSKHFENEKKYQDNLQIYEEYFKKISKYLESYNKTSTKFILTIIKNNKWGHLTGNIRHAIKFVNTEYLLVLQHDMSFCKNINISSIIKDMKENPQLKHIQFHRNNNVENGWFKDKYNFLNNNNIITKNNSYISTLAWADQNHLTTKKYYTDIVLNLCKNGCFMEAVLSKKNNNPSTHKKFGTYFLGEFKKTKYTNHISGKNSLWWSGKYKIL